MELNPFSSFRKYQKFWMACILLLCMVTFVLCTGQRGGDFMDFVQRLVGNRTGTALITVNGVSYDYEAVDRLKQQRNLADAFMKKSCSIAVEILDEMYKRESKKEIKESDKRGKEQQATFLATVGFMKQQFQQRLMRPRYFEGGVKLDELANFLMWKNEADRRGVYLEDGSVLDIYDSMMLNAFTRERFGYYYFSPDQSRRALYDIIRDFRYASEDALLDALRQEFRVRIAQLADMQAQVASYAQRGSPQQGKLPRSLRLEFPLTIRAPLSPDQLWEKYENQRSEFDVRLLPIPVEHFVPQLERILAEKEPKIKPPSDAELATLFEKHKTAKYDPASATSGFEVPHRIKVAYVMADPQSKVYQNAAQAALLFETVPLAPNVIGSPLATLVSYTMGQAALDASLERDYENYRKRATGEYETLPLDEKNILPLLLSRKANEKPSTEAVAGLTAGVAGSPLAGVLSFRAFTASQYPQLKEIAATEEARREKVYAEYADLAAQLVASGATGPLVPRDPFVPAVLAAKLGKLMEAEKYLPLAVVRDEIKKKRVNLMATSWAQENMNVVRDTLAKVAGKQNAFDLQLGKLVEKYHLEQGQTKDYHNRFNIAKATELQPLKDAFNADQILDQINIIEGRAQNSDQALTKEDFAKLFFDLNEEFSAANERYRARPWPPVIKAKSDVRALQEPDAAPKTIDLFASAEKPILFWKTEDKSAEILPNLAAARQRVEEAWKTQKAREKLAIPHAQDVAERLQKSGGDYLSILEQEAEKVGRDLIALDNVSPLSKVVLRAGAFDYRDFKMPKENLPYPVEKLAEQVLSLEDLKQPIKTGNNEVDNVNKYLFDIAKKSDDKIGVGKYVQILTNKPQSEFYVAAVIRRPGAEFADFRRAYQFSMGLPNENNPATWTDDFIDFTQAQFATKYREEMLDSLKSRYKVTIDDSRSKDFE